MGTVIRLSCSCSTCVLRWGCECDEMRSGQMSHPPDPLAGENRSPFGHRMLAVPRIRGNTEMLSGHMREMLIEDLRTRKKTEQLLKYRQLGQRCNSSAAPRPLPGVLLKEEAAMHHHMAGLSVHPGPPPPHPARSVESRNPPHGLIDHPHMLSKPHAMGAHAAARQAAPPAGARQTAAPPPQDLERHWLAKGHAAHTNAIRKLSDEELQLCALLKLEVVQFALIKQMLIAESLQSGFLDKKMAIKLYSDQHPHIPQPLLQVDLLKVGSIYEFFMQNEQCFH